MVDRYKQMAELRKPITAFLQSFRPAGRFCHCRDVETVIKIAKFALYESSLTIDAQAKRLGIHRVTIFRIRKKLRQWGIIPWPMRAA